MSKTFSNNMPIYAQIIDMVKLSIALGTYTPGQKIPSVRDLAIEYGVNPNTMQKALTKLEELHLLRAERTSGRFVTLDTDVIEGLKKEIPKKIIKSFLQDMENCGIKTDQIIEHVQQYIAEN
ncbi:MAG: GntR family transcriptional regulator [Defluviitaleaceae bacterium]|nr:GntR family transcriptional regulator [Defluviitaleaceae bacterium]